MHQISRRSFVKGIGALPFALALPRVAGATDPVLRYDLASPQGRDMLAIYADAVRKMQAYPNMTPLHWSWQWYTHFVTGTTTKADEISRIWGIFEYCHEPACPGDVGHLPALRAGSELLPCPGTACSSTTSSRSCDA